MLSLIRRAYPAIIGIAALLCLDAALIGVGWIAVSEEPLGVDPIAGNHWTSPDLTTPPLTTGQDRVPEANDPVLARPIFFQSRKPFEPSAAPPPPRSPPPDPRFVVDGIMLTGGARKAHLRQPHETDGRWHETGQVIDGWMIVQIDAAGIMVEQAEQRLAIRLYPSDSRVFRVIRRSSR